MRPQGVVEILLRLDEPWRSRFLKLIARTVVSTWDGRNPTREELTGWLKRDLELYRWTLQLLHAWGAFKDRKREQDIR